MQRRRQYRSYQSQRNRSKKKKIITIAIVILAAVGFVVAICVVSFNKNGYGLAMQSSVEEMTQMRIRMKEMEDEIISLQAEIEAYKAELALRPASTAAPIEPPNEEVATMQSTPEPTSTPKPRSTKKPQLPTQPPQPPVEEYVPPAEVQAEPEAAPVEQPVSEPEISSTEAADEVPQV